jgi:hypothetical protein
MKKVLGKIERVTLGGGGYQDAMFGVNFTLATQDGHVQDFWGTWSTYSEHAKYSKIDWERSHFNAYSKLIKIMTEAKASDIRDLEGKPVEVLFEGDRLSSWRILTEVL